MAKFSHGKSKGPERKSSGRPATLPPRGGAPRRDDRTSRASGLWVYGQHAVAAALMNPERVVRRIVGTRNALERLAAVVDTKRKLPATESLEPSALDQLLGNESVHQGIGAQVEPLAFAMLEDILHIKNPTGPLLVLDQVSDPHNVGAILRSAAAFNAVAVMVPKDHSAPETAVMAKAASGALDLVPRISVTNLATALRDLKAAGWWVTGLSGDAKKSLHELKLAEKTVLVLGAEGRGMRRLTAELCDELAKLPIDSQMESLNVSNAAAIALYHCAMVRKNG